MPAIDAIKAIASSPKRALGWIAKRVELASRRRTHRLTRVIVRRRSRFLFVLASTWPLLVAALSLTWFAITSENPSVSRWLHKSRLWVGVAVPVLSWVYARRELHRRWELLEHRRQHRRRMRLRRSR